MAKLKAGDKVAWETSQGKTSGVVKKQLTSKTKIKSHVVAASKQTLNTLSKARKAGKKPRISHPRSRKSKPAAAGASAPNESALRLGFAVKVLGVEGLKSNDSRRWQQSPHLRVSLDYLQRIFDYLEKQSIRMYRISSDIAPYVTHPEMPQFHQQVRECAAELRALGRRARELDLRLSFHPSQFIVLNSPDPTLVRKSVADLAAQAKMLDAMELGPEAVLVVHAGGTYGNVERGRSD